MVENQNKLILNKLQIIRFYFLILHPENRDRDIRIVR